MKRIGVVSGTRADAGIWRSILEALHRSTDFSLQLYLTGAHLSPAFGMTGDLLEAEGFPIAARIPLPLEDDSPAGIARSMGLGVTGFADAFGSERPDLLMVLGDRFEMMAAALAAVPFALPLAHVHGGEVTEGAFDEQLRHALTKLSHLHFASTEVHAQRIVQMGEEPWRVVCCGAPALDALQDMELPTREALEAIVKLDLLTPPLLVTYHPATLTHGDARAEVEALLEAISTYEGPILLTGTNADTSGRAIQARLETFAATHPRTRMVPNLGQRNYFGAMALSAAMVGNSSSGLVEAPSFHLPVVNIGPRQKGRTRGANVIDAAPTREAIGRALTEALSPGFRSRLADQTNPYQGPSRAADHVLKTFRKLEWDRLIPKPFFSRGVGP